MPKTIEVEFDLGEQVIPKQRILKRAKGEDRLQIDDSWPVEKIIAELDRDGNKMANKYYVDGLWRWANELTKKEDARKEALKFLVSCLEAVSAQ